MRRGSQGTVQLLNSRTVRSAHGIPQHVGRLDASREYDSVIEVATSVSTVTPICLTLEDNGSEHVRNAHHHTSFELGVHRPLQRLGTGWQLEDTVTEQLSRYSGRDMVRNHEVDLLLAPHEPVRGTVPGARRLEPVSEPGQGLDNVAHRGLRRLDVDDDVDVRGRSGDRDAGS